MKKITILSGKGGVGKSSVTASLAVGLSKDKRIVCADCDVDASNLALVLGVEKFKEWNGLSTNEKAVIDHDKCINCKKCVEACYFDAISFDGKPMINESKCEGCGVCKLVCPENAINLKKVENAKIGYANTKYGFNVVSAQLNIGESGSGKVVSEVRKLAEKRSDGAELMLIDAAAGIGCPVIASVTGVDYVLAVTEPTPSGLSDLKRAITLVDHFNISCGIIINKFDINQVMTQTITGFAAKQGVEIIEKIPYNRSFVDALVKLVPIIEYDKNFHKIFKRIAEHILNKIER